MKEPPILSRELFIAHDIQADKSSLISFKEKRVPSRMSEIKAFPESSLEKKSYSNSIKRVMA